MHPALDALEAADDNVEKVEVVGIRFRSAGKMYYFDPQKIKLKKGDSAVVETTRGPEFGDVCLGNTMINATSVVSPLRPVIRPATQTDVETNLKNRQKESEALKICQEKIREHKLEMKLIDVQYAFDGSKILFYFSADGRVDFRELVKDLASVFRTRIELRQIGIRDEAKLLGGIGACGRTLCCATFLPDFAQVSIKMAKDQNLSLNSSKISGLCGRLMCCLRYEEEVYQDEIRKTPPNDSTVQTPDGIGTVIGSNPLAKTVRVLLKDQTDTPPKQYSRDDVTVLPKEKKTAQAHESRTEKSAKNN
ncbi:MAG: stage 0 sporulation family protein [Clostridia bacterium]|nr:stage 0 sporulation family protein [Clostridia bacterium]